MNFLFSVRIIADIPEVSASSASAAAPSTPSTVKTKITAPSPVNNGSSAASNALSRNLWVSGLSSLTRATDLKMSFSKYGKVIGAKVVTNTRTPGQKCFGYVTMSTAKDATECISHIHRTELHGRKISVERAKSDLGPPKSNGSSTLSSTKPADKASASNGNDKKKEDTKKGSKDAKDSNKSRDKKDEKSGAKPERKRISPPRSDSKEKSKSTKPKDDKSAAAVAVVDKSRSKPSPVKKDVVSYDKMREERERQRLREKERELREEERRRREIRRRQREEEQRLAREREKLAIERRKIEEQKAELLRIERERQKLERDKIELERLELKRQQRKYG